MTYFVRISSSLEQPAVAPVLAEGRGQAYERCQKVIHFAILSHA